MDSERKPLMTRNGVSKLPMPGSRLKPPTSYKRARSPDEESESASSVGSNSKKSRLEDEPARVGAGRPAGGIPSISRPPTRPGPKVSAGVSRPAPGQGMVRSTSNSSVGKAAVADSKKGSFAKPGMGARSNSASSRLDTTRTGVSKVSHKPATTRTNAQSTNGPATAPAKAGGKKRQPWDLKGRLQDMEAAMQQRAATSATLTAQLTSQNDRIEQLESQKQQLSGDVAKQSEQAEAVSARNEELQRQLRDIENEKESSCRKLQQEIDDLKFSKSSLERQNTALEGELSVTRKEITSLQSSVAHLTSLQSTIASELEAKKLSLEQAFRDIKARDDEIAELKETVAQRDATLAENHRTIIQHETARRQLHNTIQELKGNIRVFCRVRPLLGEELSCSDGVIHHINFPDPDNRVMELDRLTEMSMNESTLCNTRRGNSKYEFCFDRVFQPEVSQADVFEEIAQLVQSALDGYNVCIFAYGQTGSGKTYTMEGGAAGDDTQGMIPRAVSQIFSTAAELEDKGWQYKFSASFLEIYNETIGDLLGSGKDKAVKHEIRLSGKDSHVTVTNLTEVPVTSEGQIAKLLRQASENRAVAATKCNERSSRSHSVFMLHLTGNNSITSETCQGTLNLVDLAGSERLKDSGSEGKRLKETQAINRSLSHLGNVIMALGNKENHVPYRDSKLTYLLQNSLGGNSKTLMFVNVSPREENFSETLNSLRFATKVNQCNIGTAQKRSK